VLPLLDSNHRSLYGALAVTNVVAVLVFTILLDNVHFL